ARTMSSRRPAIASPTISSDSPAEYTSAVSTKLTPASNARCAMRTQSSWSRLPHWPNIMAPRQYSVAWTRELPSGPRCTRAGPRPPGRAAYRRRNGLPVELGRGREVARDDRVESFAQHVLGDVSRRHIEPPPAHGVEHEAGNLGRRQPALPGQVAQRLLHEV